MSLSDEAIYDIVAYVVSGETINPDSKPVPFSEYEYKCYSLAHHVWTSGFDETAEALCTGILFGDRKRLLEDALAAMLANGAGAPGSGANNERAAHRRAIKARIEELFGASPQPNTGELTLDARDRVAPPSDTQYDVAELRAAGWTDTQIVRHCAPVKLHAASFADYYNARVVGVEESRSTAEPEPMTAAHTLRTAADLVGGDRNASHGDMTENHQNIASLWEGYLGVPIKPHDVAVMMCLLKIARTKSGRTNPDDYVDLAGYAGIAAEIKGGENNA